MAKDGGSLGVFIADEYLAAVSAAKPSGSIGLFEVPGVIVLFELVGVVLIEFPKLGNLATTFVSEGSFSLGIETARPGSRENVNVPFSVLIEPNIGDATGLASAFESLILMVEPLGVKETELAPNTGGFELFIVKIDRLQEV